jgi:enoyl-CoA hydratase
MSSEITVERRNTGAAVLTLDAPQRRNALTAAMAAELVVACEEIDNDPEIGAVVVRGAGSYFCAGGDRQTLARIGADPAAPEAFAGLSAVYRSFVRVGELEPPTIAAVRGGALGAGMNLVLATDVRIVARDARLQSGFIAIGLHAGGGHNALLGRAGSREAAAAMSLFGEVLDGEQAERVGLAWKAVDSEDVEDTALAMAERAAADPELARATTRSFRRVLGPPLLSWDAALEIERGTQMWSMRRKHLAAEDG